MEIFIFNKPSHVINDDNSSSLCVNTIIIFKIVKEIWILPYFLSL